MPWGQGQEMTLTFHTFISSISCLHLPTFRSHRLQYFLKNPLFSIFPIEKLKLPYLILPYNRPRSTQDHHLNKLWWAGVPDAAYQVSWKSVHRFRRFLKGSCHIRVWRPSWSCDQHDVHGFSFPCTWKLTYKICFKMAKWFLRKTSFNFHT